MRTHSAGLHHKSGAAASAARVERARARVTRRHYGWLAYRGMAPVYLLLLVALCVEINQRLRFTRHRADVVTGTTSRRWPENSTPLSRHSYGDNIASMA